MSWEDITPTPTPERADDSYREEVVLGAEDPLRDRAKGTNIHRRGGWGNKILSELSWESRSGSGGDILALIRRSCTLFDDLASRLSCAYRPRYEYLTDVIDQARDHSGSRRSEPIDYEQC